MVAITLLLSTIMASAQIKNTKTESVKIYGNCEMCKAKIEKAGNIKKIAKVTWDDQSQIATLQYDAKKTNQDQILKRIALVGYDSDKFLAPDKVYSKLDGCCKYDRVAKVVVKEMPKTEMADMVISNNPGNQIINQLNPVFDNYFAIKEALVKTDGKTASAKAKDLLSGISAVKMETLKIEEHMVWMKVLENLKQDANTISTTIDIKKQRDAFDTLSANIYQLIKVSKQETPTYLEHCPMANNGKGADWLSKENTIKNPYYGSMMLSCGKVVETIK